LLDFQYVAIRPPSLSVDYAPLAERRPCAGKSLQKSAYLPLGANEKTLISSAEIPRLLAWALPARERLISLRVSREKTHPTITAAKMPAAIDRGKLAPNTLKPCHPK
jgi:hypothetical protein